MENPEKNRQEIQDYVNRWDTEGVSEGVTMGWAPIHSNAIHFVAVELLRWLLNSEVEMKPALDFDEQRSIDNLMTDYCMSQPHLVTTGATIGKAVEIAYKFWVYGLTHMMNIAKADIPDRVVEFKNPSLTA